MKFKNKSVVYIIGFCFLSILLLISAPVVCHDTGDSKIYTDTNNTSFNISAEPKRIDNGSGYVSVKVEANKSVNKTFKLNFEDKNFTIKLDNNKTSVISTDEFNIKSVVNKNLDIIDNDTVGGNVSLNVSFKNIEVNGLNVLNPSDPMTTSDDTDNTIYVSKSGSDSNTYGNKTNPYFSVGRAILEANNNKTRQFIVLDNGTYTNTTNCYILKTNLTITGKAFKEPSQNPVILDGGEKYRLCNITNEVNVNFENITFKNANASTNDLGGAIYVNDSNSNLSLYNCKFYNNSATTKTGGGAIHFNASHLSIDSCIFENNSGGLGGALYNNGAHILGIANSLFKNNSASDHGGAIDNVYGNIEEGGAYAEIYNSNFI
jgi:hypothetical protein